MYYNLIFRISEAKIRVNVCCISIQKARTTKGSRNKHKVNSGRWVYLECLQGKKLTLLPR